MTPVNEAERHLDPDPDHPPGEPLPGVLIAVVLGIVLWTLIVIAGQFVVGMW